MAGSLGMGSYVRAALVFGGGAVLNDWVLQPIAGEMLNIACGDGGRSAVNCAYGNQMIGYFLAVVVMSILVVLLSEAYYSTDGGIR